MYNPSPSDGITSNFIRLDPQTRDANNPEEGEQ